MPEDLAQAAHEELEALGVDVRVGAMVTSVDPETVHLKSGVRITAKLKVWAAGVKGPPMLADLDGIETNRSNQIVVRPTLHTATDERIYAIGDCCACPKGDGTGNVPPRAQAASQMAKSVHDNLVSAMVGRAQRPFVYRDRGSLVSLSRFSTVGSLMGNLIGGRMAIEGRLARLAYVSLYRMHLLAVHGWLRGMAMIVVGHVNQIVRPKLKLH